VDPRRGELPYDGKKPIPPGYRVETSLRRGILIGGIATFGASYGLSAALAVNDLADDSWDPLFDAQWLWLPLAGPWVAMTTTRKDCTTQNQYPGTPTVQMCQSSTGTSVGLAVLGGAQAVGAALAIYGMVAPTRKLVRTQASSTLVEPVMMGRDGYGLAVTGLF
jgi:hypothetical protein